MVNSLHYFAYGVNLSPTEIKKMYRDESVQAPPPRLAVVKNWKWIINGEGSVTIVEESGHVVWGKIYPMSILNEASLDAARLHCIKGFLKAKFDEKEEDVLVYIDVQNVTAGEPKQEQKAAINEGVKDLLEIAEEDRTEVERYVKKYIRPLIPSPEEEEEEENKKMEEDAEKGLGHFYH